MKLNSREKKELFVETFKEDILSYDYFIKEKKFFKVDMEKGLFKSINIDLNRYGFLNEIHFSVLPFASEISEDNIKSNGYGRLSLLSHGVEKAPFNFDPQNLGLVDFSIGLDNALAVFRKTKVIELMEKVLTLEESLRFLENYGIFAHGEAPRSEKMIYGYIAATEYEKAIETINQMVYSSEKFFATVSNERSYGISEESIIKRRKRAEEKISSLVNLKNKIEIEPEVFEPIIRGKIKTSEYNCKKYFGKLIR